MAPFFGPQFGSGPPANLNHQPQTCAQIGRGCTINMLAALQKKKMAQQGLASPYGHSRTQAQMLWLPKAPFWRTPHPVPKGGLGGGGHN